MKSAPGARFSAFSSTSIYILRFHDAQDLRLEAGEGAALDAADIALRHAGEARGLLLRAAAAAVQPVAHGYYAPVTRVKRRDSRAQRRGVGLILQRAGNAALRGQGVLQAQRLAAVVIKRLVKAQLGMARPARR